MKIPYKMVYTYSVLMLSIIETLVKGKNKTKNQKTKFPKFENFEKWKFVYGRQAWHFNF